MLLFPKCSSDIRRIQIQDDFGTESRNRIDLDPLPVPASFTMSLTRTIVTTTAIFVSLGLSFTGTGRADVPIDADEPRLLEILEGTGPEADKAMACKRLATRGTKASAQALGRLLDDPQLASWARIPLEAIPDPAMDAELRQALDRTQGRLLVGVINSIAVRRDVQAESGLVERLNSTEEEVAIAAAVALGKLGGTSAAGALTKHLDDARVDVRNAAAEGCILLAERWVQAQEKDRAFTLLRKLSEAELAPQRRLEAIRAMILSEGDHDLSPLLESADLGMFRLALTLIREIENERVVESVDAKLEALPVERQALVILALGDRVDPKVVPRIAKWAQHGTGECRLAALEVLKSRGDASHLDLLLSLAQGGTDDAGGAALEALCALPAAEVDKALLARFQKRTRPDETRLIARVLGRRRYALATPELLRAAGDSDLALRIAALQALGGTMSEVELPMLLERLTSAKEEVERSATLAALKEACPRMADRDACAARVAESLVTAPLAAQLKMVEILGAIGGERALDAVADLAAKSPPEVVESASRVLGEWMTPDAAPKLLKLAASADEAKYRVRALRGLLRVVRQFELSQADREMYCAKAVDVAERDEERRLILEILGRYPSLPSLETAVRLSQRKELQELGLSTAHRIAQDLGNPPAAKEILDKVGTPDGQADSDGFVSLFDGKTLEGWEGDPRVWSVRDGTITGETTETVTIDANTFLIHKGAPLRDFELRLEYRIRGGNSGIQYRSARKPEVHPFSVGGYQADLDATNQYTGILYEERGRGILALRGQEVVIDAEGKSTPKEFATAASLAEKIHADGWNAYRVVAKGSLLQHHINDILMSQTDDRDAAHRVEEGILALQLHQGPPMTVQFRNVRLRRITTENEAKEAGESPAKTSKETSSSEIEKLLSPKGFSVKEGFRAELIYEVPRDKEGSWVCLCVDPRGRLIASDQYGRLYRVQPSATGKGTTGTQVERLQVDLGMAQGMCWVGDRFYVVVNGESGGDELVEGSDTTKSAKRTSGLYVLRDRDGDDQFEEVRLLRAIEGEGEHGPHAVIPAPDGQSIYVISGNHTKLTPVDSSRVPQVWNEDQLLPRMWDASGHAVGIMAPGGWICRCDLEGKQWELVSCGYRNAYDLAFNQEGDLFTYDSDMEWDLGAPWYRPTRICHATPGSEFGWRSGSGNWPDSFPDSLPPLVELGTGSPTGLTFGYGLAGFPAKYQAALYACDWSFGKIYAIHLTPDGGSYRADVEEFLTGTPLPITDIVCNPNDSAMYFAVGGRRTFSALYRVTPTRVAGVPPTTESVVSVSPESRLRREIEALQGKLLSPAALDVIWNALGHSDRFVRFAARSVLEGQPPQNWRGKIRQARGTWQSIEAVLAAARTVKGFDPQLADELVRLILTLNWNAMSPSETLAALRGLELVFIRVSPNDPKQARQVSSALMRSYPAESAAITMALARLLAYTTAAAEAGDRALFEEFVAATLNQMEQAITQEEQVHYAYVLRPFIAQSSPASQLRYFTWFTTLKDVRGGHSLRKFLHNIREEAATPLSLEAHTRLDPTIAFNLLEETPSESLIAGPVVKEYSTEEISAIVASSDVHPDLDLGRRAFSKALCFRCHRMGAEGGSTGPDLTTAGRRFDARYLIESITDPDKEISDRFRSSQFVMADGKIVSGRVANLDHDEVLVVTNMFDPGSTVALARDQIEEVNAIAKSEMPTGLLNTLTAPEIRALFAYLRGAQVGGD